MEDRYQKLVADAKRTITEIRPTDAAEKMKSSDVVVVDVREKDEWDEGHIPDAIHLSRGTIELDIEERVPDVNTTVIVHCGGGGRSALVAESLQKWDTKTCDQCPVVQSLESRGLTEDGIILLAINRTQAPVLPQ